MSLATPTTQEVSDNILAQIEGALGETTPLLPKAFQRVLAKALSGVYVLLYRYAGFIFLQQFVAHATFRETIINGRAVKPLVEWGRLVGVGDPTPATHAELSIDVTVEVQTGTLPAGSQLVFPDTGVIYLTVGDVALDAATKTVTIRAASDQEGGGGAGTIGNLEAGDVVSFASPLSNVARDATVLSQVVTGADGESESAYRGRVIDRFQRIPQGGAYADYKLWGEEVEGILAIFPYTGDPGEVDVFVEATIASSGSADGIPTAAQLQAVDDAIQLDDAGLASRRPSNAAVNVLPITRTGYDVVVTGLSDATIESDIEAGIDEHLRSLEPFIVGLSRLPRKDRVFQSAVACVAQDTASASGASITSVRLEKGGVEIPVDTLGEGEKAKLENITFS